MGGHCSISAKIIKKFQQLTVYHLKHFCPVTADIILIYHWLTLY